MSKHEHTEENQKPIENVNEQAGETSQENAAEEQVSETEKLQNELAEQKDKYIRLLAEFENYKRRTAKERIELIQTAGKDIIISLLDVLDDTDRAEKQMQTDTDINHVKEGAFLVFNKFRNVMQSKGVKALESINSDFDVEQHEAIAEIPAPTPEHSGKIIDEVQKGYLLNDKLIRHAKVVVGK
ncbi:nucleotide exchange factor GrpE [Arachidicoccus ginsenosidimutans]|uniref:nucleotide exchange factor GrpE n=1 Tax=Arachidicoccus sp. BS20 TaxID=1850526 RepID=UPI0007F13AA7|nr:nucleotide exchange factor GrpE [Arachidicoccus sp. BS20]ANI89048.1 nucleotide exchange factor GrpE [Arachidicoccus sp. BS20]